ncbi:SpoIIE family protein phosphatase [Streptomyces sp. NPDC020801]|uniref:ATP-binding SpoIIE family protein phosphatase n=1 Tax=unclassified Streptomyces TaxID=2593676 RepID=UPI0037BBAAFF
MDEKHFLPSGAPNHPQGGCRDAVLARALTAVHERLLPSAAAAYLLSSDGSLTASTVLDTPLAFTVAPFVAVTDRDMTVAISHRSGKLAVKGPTEVHEVVRAAPITVLQAPFAAMVVASAPIRTAQRRFGVLAVRWVPDRDVPTESLDFLISLADEVAASLDHLAAQGVSMEAPDIPLYIPVGAGSSSEINVRSGTIPGEWRERTSSGRFLFQLQRLGLKLTAASRVADVISATQSVVVRPFGGRAVTLCLLEHGRLRVAGSSGACKEDLRGVEGILLEEGTPEADAALLVQPMVFASSQELLAAYPDLDRYHDGRPRAFLPLVSNGRPVGCCIMVFDRPPDLRNDELAILTAMLGQVAQSLERTHGIEVLQAVARGMQRSLLPRGLSNAKEVETTARYLPATVGAEVGGDWYDVIRPRRNMLGMIIGDVEGHSLDAVGVMGQLRSAVRAYATEGHDPASVLIRSNRLLSELETELFATCTCMWLDLESGTAILSSAGHHPPIIVDACGRTVSTEVMVGPPLGVDPDAVYRQTEFVISPGGLAAFFTDGLVGTRTADVEDVIERLRRRVAEHVDQNLETLADRLIEDSDARAQRDDDIALLLMRFMGTHGAVARIADTSVQRHDIGRVRDVRHFVHDVAVDWGLDTLVDELELLVSEVVTNGLIHAQSEVDVRIRQYDDRLRVEVRDNDPYPPIPAAVLDIEETGNDAAESGRGLLIVDAIASDWGSSPTGRGKTTWFEITVPAA